MQCPSCQHAMRDAEYENVLIRTCDGCGGEFVEADALAHIVNTREQRFPAATDRSDLAAQKPVFGVPAAERRRVLDCPVCENAMDVGNYGGDSGIFVDRCSGCGGVWLDRDELENVQMLMESWADEATSKLQALSTELEHARREAAEAVSESFTGSRFAFVNAIVNRVLDAA